MIPQTPKQRREAAEAWVAWLKARHSLAKKLGLEIGVDGRLYVKVPA